MAIDSLSSRTHFSHWEDPKDMHPRITLETWRPDLPRRWYSIVGVVGIMMGGGSEMVG